MDRLRFRLTNTLPGYLIGAFFLENRFIFCHIRSNRWDIYI